MLDQSNNKNVTNSFIVGITDPMTFFQEMFKFQHKQSHYSNYLIFYKSLGKC